MSSVLVFSIFLFCCCCRKRKKWRGFIEISVRGTSVDMEAVSWLHVDDCERGRLRRNEELRWLTEEETLTYRRKKAR